MEETALLVDPGPGPHDHLDQDYQLDLNATVEVDEFDFQLEGFYDKNELTAKDAAPDLIDATADSNVNADPDPEIGYKHEEAQPASEELAPQNENGQHPDGDAHPDLQEEIGYDEEDQQNNGDEDDNTNNNGDDGGDDVGDDDGVGDNGANEHEDEDTYSVGNERPGLGPRLSADPLTEQSEPHQIPSRKSEAGFETSTAPDPEHDEADGARDSGLAEQDADDTAEGAYVGDISMEEMEEMDQDSFDREAARAYYADPSSGVDQIEFDKVLADLTSPGLRVPEIEVIYNGHEYNLFGDDAENPDTFFFSDPDVLDSSMGDFLLSLRYILGNEVAESDELRVELEEIDLEFGERSNEEFLSRSPREVFDAWARLLESRSGGGGLVMRLLVCRDPEIRFVELLAETAGTSHAPSEAAASGTDEAGDEEAGQDGYQQSDQGSNDDEPVAEVQDTAGSAEVDVAQDQGAFEFESDPDESNDGGEDEFDEHVDLVTADEGHGEETHSGDVGEASIEQDYSEGRHVAHGEDEVEGSTEGQEYVEGLDDGAENLTTEFAELGQPEEQDTYQAEEETTHDADEVTAHASGGETATEEQHVDDNQPKPTTGADTDADADAHDSYYDFVEMDGDDGGEQAPQEEEGQWDLEHSALIADPVATERLASAHTSTTSTLAGDEIDYDDHNHADESFTPGGDEAAAVGAEFQGEDGEIDWDLGGDEPDEDADRDDDGQPEDAPTPSSAIGKRSRTDEEESLDEESGNKRRRILEA